MGFVLTLNALMILDALCDLVELFVLLDADERDELEDLYERDDETGLPL